MTSINCLNSCPKNYIIFVAGELQPPAHPLSTPSSYVMSILHQKGEIIAIIQTSGHGWHLVLDVWVQGDSTPSPTTHFLHCIQYKNPGSWYFPWAQPHSRLRLGSQEPSATWEGPHCLHGKHAVWLLVLSMNVSRCGRETKIKDMNNMTIDTRSWSWRTITQGNPCIWLTCGKFELTNQDSAGGKNFTVLTSM